MDAMALRATAKVSPKQMAPHSVVSRMNANGCELADAETRVKNDKQGGVDREIVNTSAMTHAQKRTAYRTMEWVGKRTNWSNAV